MASCSSSFPLGTTESLLADLASQHERLEQLTVDLSSALLAAQAATGYAQRLLKGAPSDGQAGEPLSPGGVQAGAALKPPLALPSVAVDSVPNFGVWEETDEENSLEGELERAGVAARLAEPPTRVPESQWRTSCRKLLPLSDGAPDGSTSGSHAKGGEDRDRLPPLAVISEVGRPDTGTQSLRTKTEELTTSNTTKPSWQSSVQSSVAEELWEGTGQMSNVRRNAVFRLQARLGKRGFSGQVTALDVHRAVTSLGLVKYSALDLEKWLTEVIRVCTRRGSLPSVGSGLEKVVVGIKKVGKSGLFSPEDSTDAQNGKHVSIQCMVFTEWILREDAAGQVDAEFQQMTATLREVLFSGDANRLVAELTNVRVDDVAAPMERPDFLVYMEPVVGFMIFLNGIFIGLQTGQPEASGVDEWFWGNTAFAVFFTFEITLRLCTVGFVEFVTGLERWWNFFDIAVVSISVLDIIMEATNIESEVAPMTVLRILRLTRIVRLVRLFRLHYMKELNLMVRGLMGGLHTLFCAMILLFFTLYVIGILATTTIGQNPNPVPEIARDELFATLPQAVFTSFRCFMSDCYTSDGKPIVKLLSDRYGITFILGYFAGMVFVTFGLFNLIIAIYIENTMHAAKTEGDHNRQQRHRESVRIARLTRQLLKKFCAVQSVWNEFQNGASETHDVRRAMSHATFNDLGEMSMPVSKDMFLCIIQDASVQKLMDELDIPPERASLFDVLDADGSGDLQLMELITGLLRVRGEAKKSDIVGTLLAVRVVQEMIREQSQHVTELEGRLDSVQQAVGCGERVLQRPQLLRIERTVQRKSSITTALERLNLSHHSSTQKKAAQ